MNEETNRVLPFFINTKRLQRDDSYFDIGRTQDRLRRILIERRNAKLVTAFNDEDLDEEYGVVGYYGVSRFINLDEDDKDLANDDCDLGRLGGFDDDVQFDKTSGFQLFWMTFKRLVSSIGERWLSSKPERRSSFEDLEFHESVESRDFYSSQELCKIIIEPSFSTLHDPRVRNDIIVYGDVNFLVQKFRMELQCGSVDVALFSVDLCRSAGQSECSTDLQTFVVTPECGSYVWIERGRASAIFLTRSSKDFFGSIMEWFRKILSDMVLADSVMIGHPYYWQPTVRRRLRRVMKYLKRLYTTLARKEKLRLDASHHNALKTGMLEVVRPTEISKIVINEQPSENFTHASSTYQKLNIMLDEVVHKWFEYNFNIIQSPSESVQDISKTHTVLNPQHNNSDQMLESVTFLDFYPEKRQPPPSPDVSRGSSYTSDHADSRPQSPGRDFEEFRPAHPEVFIERSGKRSKYREEDINHNYTWSDHTYPNRTVVGDVDRNLKSSRLEQEVDSESDLVQ